jgi:spore maturation protein CgeB
MRIKLFYHSILSDWNHVNAHFLRGIVSELRIRGLDVEVWEPENGWSLQNLTNEKGEAYVQELIRQFPEWKPNFYQLGKTDFSDILADADLVLVHEWNEPELISHIGKLRASHNFRLLFHDTHHRSVTAPEEMEKYDLAHYDGVLAFGEVIRDLYLKKKWASQAWTWHEAADNRLFHPHPDQQKKGDLVWIGNWGDNERTEELIEFLIEPVKALGLDATMFGVRYPKKALDLLQDAGIHYGGYLPSNKVPETLSQYRMTVHVPRRPYVQFLPGIPTIRPFEALACGIPLISSTWHDSENLFDVGEDFLMVSDGQQMKEQMEEVLKNKGLCQKLIENGRQKIQNRNSCEQREDELLAIYKKLETKPEKIQQESL